MNSQAMFVDCPAYMDRDGAARCGLPAEVVTRYTLGSTSGPLECARISCARGHHFNGPVESLTVPAPTAAPSSPPSAAPSSPPTAAPSSAPSGPLSWRRR